VMAMLDEGLVVGFIVLVITRLGCSIYGKISTGVK
jgi:hypothetical protein